MVTTYASDKTTFVTIVTGDRVVRDSLSGKKAKAALELMQSGTRPEDAFVEAAAQGMLGGKTTPIVVPFTAIREVNWRSDASSGKAKYDVDGKLKTLELDSDDQAAFQAAVSAIVGLNTNKGEVDERDASVFDISLAPAGFMLAVAVIGGFLYWAAGMSPEEMESESSGRRRRRKGMFFVRIAQMIGPTGILLIAGGLLALAGFHLVSKLRNPPKRLKVTYTV